MSTIYCMHCGARLDESAHSCSVCGSPTSLGSVAAEAVGHGAVACPSCGATCDVSDGRCGSCGAELATGTTPVESATRMDPASSIHRPAHAPQQETSRTMAIGVLAASILLVVVLVSAIAAGLLGRAATPSLPSPPLQTESGEAADAASSSGDATEDLRVGSAGTEVRSALADYSWQELSIIGKEMTKRASHNEALAVAHEYHLVDKQGRMTTQTKSVTISGVGTVSMRLADVYHDYLANGEGRAGLTFLAADLSLTHEMKVNDDNIGGWEASQLRSWLDSEVLGVIDPELSPLIVAVDKRSDNVGRALGIESVTSTFDKLWIPSVVEVCGPISWLWDSDPGNSARYNAVLNAEGSQYACFSVLGVDQEGPNAGLVLRGAEGALPWWLRSCSASKDAHYRLVGADGDPSQWGMAPDVLGVCLGFCL